MATYRLAEKRGFSTTILLDRIKLPELLKHPTIFGLLACSSLFEERAVILIIWSHTEQERTMRLLSRIELLMLFGLVTLTSVGCHSSSSSSPPPPPPEPFKAYLKASNTSSSSLFGESVAISGDGNTAAVGAKLGEGDESGIADQTGAVYVFKRTVAGDGAVSWNEVARVSAPTPTFGDFFGLSVALSEDGNVLAVGAPRRDVMAQTDQGAVFVYTGPNYDTPEEILASDGAGGDSFGQSVALSDDGLRLAVGAHQEDGAQNALDSAGAVYVYSAAAAGTNYIEEETLYANAPEAGANFGFSVALDQDGSVLAVGAYREDDMNPGDDRGAVYTFTRAAGPTWSAGTRHQASDKGDDNRFGGAVSLNDTGDRLAVGAPGDFPGGGFQGQVYVFTDSAGWTEEAIIAASNPDADDAFGVSVALNGDGNALLVGAWFEEGAGTYIVTPDTDNGATDAGAAYRFERSAGPAWTETQYIKATNTDPDDGFGSIAISDDGLRILMGASGEDSDATGVDGDQNNDSAQNSGAAYLYDL